MTLPPPSLQDSSTQQTMLTTWLIELHLNALGSLKDDGDLDGYRRVQKGFHAFLEKPSLRVQSLLPVCVLCGYLPLLRAGVSRGQP